MKVILGPNVPYRLSHALKNIKNIQTDTKTRTWDTLDLIYGLHPVYLALQEQRRSIRNIFMKKDRNKCDVLNAICHKAGELDIPIKILSASAMRVIAGGNVHQGICVRASKLNLEKNLNEIMPSRVSESKLHVILDQIHDPMNYGAILRSCYYLGVDAVLTVEGRCCPLSPVVSKASSGVMEVMKVYKIEDIIQFLKMQRKNGWKIIATTSDLDTNKLCVDIGQYTCDKSSILIVGNEGYGVSKDILNVCDDFVSIKPKRTLISGVDSLNVSVATAIIINNLVNQLKS